MATATASQPFELSWHLLLQEEFARRREANKAYSLRAFARTLDLSPAFTSFILRKQRSLSHKIAAQIASQLKWPKGKTELFLVLVDLDKIEDGAHRDDLTERARILAAGDQEYHKLDFDTFRLISDWFHAAVIELTRIKSFKPEPLWVAKRLKISLLDAELALERLVRLGLLKKTKGTYERCLGPTTTADVPSKYIRQFHRDMMTKGTAALEGQTPDNRDITGVTMAIDKSKLPMAREKIRQLQKDLSAMLSTDSTDAVYHLGIQLFRVDLPDGGALPAD